ncbi:uncharacterized protein F4822DRAFT_335886 [Hypoxylon trugodes]|uniref:uncharacterized protein n=1 Tax=Hypoxylon trugodes TaxID=326681 RepID=UPI00219D1C83|nr:uncharacterized protein F4822DRAFT_335886 [Hypoxylon trugodes]KAI1385174.1 hypothetical protein F4822DRAFT_335886 [Hypoxylon trugodes]
MNTLKCRHLRRTEMDNSTDGDKTIGNTGMDSATLAGVISTAISFVALIVSSIQLLYQYYTNVSLNALGARNCNSWVMGPWAGATRRRWRWLELRFEIIFQSPILFVAPAFNRRGPVPGREIWYIDGSDQSYQETRTPLPIDAGSLPRTTAIRRGVNVEATWVLLLRTLQSMERDSARWHELMHFNVDAKKPRPFSARTIAVAVQAQTLSWDFVPNFKKPFAGTTICHIVEIAAMLGIYWTMWDSKADRYRAEGNGCILLGSFNAEQGIVFTLVRHDKTVFLDNRLIPNNSIKRFCFGFSPTFYFLDKYEYLDEKNMTKRPTEPILPMLKLGSRQEIAETLMDIGCPITVAEYFLNEDARTSHLFPVIFDVLGMLGRSLSVEGYCYRMLPNPTIFRWDRRWFNTRRLLLVFKEYQTELYKNYAAAGDIPGPLISIRSALDRLSSYLENPLIKDFSPILLDNLREVMSTLDTLLIESSEDEDHPSETIVLETVNRHIACVVADLSQRPSRLLDLFPLGRANEGANEVSLISFLFERSRWAATHIYNPDLSIAHREFNQRFAITKIEVNVVEKMQVPTCSLGLRDRPRLRDTTWCLLVFRMLCWLQLHDFHKDDVMVPRSATYGSRMPVYII